MIWIWTIFAGWTPWKTKGECKSRGNVAGLIGKGALEMFAKIFKYSDLSWKDLTNIKRWFRQDASRNGFSLESFNPSIRVAQALNSAGQTICLTPIESC